MAHLTDAELRYLYTANEKKNALDDGRYVRMRRDHVLAIVAELQRRRSHDGEEVPGCEYCDGEGL